MAEPGPPEAGPGSAAASSPSPPPAGPPPLPLLLLLLVHPGADRHALQLSRRPDGRRSRRGPGGRRHGRVDEGDGAEVAPVQGLGGGVRHVPLAVCPAGRPGAGHPHEEAGGGGGTLAATSSGEEPGDGRLPGGRGHPGL